MVTHWRGWSACAFSVNWVRTRVRTRARTFLGLLDLKMKSAAPSSSPSVSASSSLSSLSAVTKMTGMSRVAGSALSAALARLV